MYYKHNDRFDHVRRQFRGLVPHPEAPQPAQPAILAVILAVLAAKMAAFVAAGAGWCKVVVENQDQLLCLTNMGIASGFPYHPRLYALAFDYAVK